MRRTAVWALGLLLLSTTGAKALVYNFDGYDNVQRKTFFGTKGNLDWNRSWLLYGADYYNGKSANKLASATGNFLVNGHDGFRVAAKQGEAFKFKGASLSSFKGLSSWSWRLAAETVNVYGYRHGKLVESSAFSLGNDFDWYATNWTRSVDTVVFDAGTSPLVHYVNKNHELRTTIRNTFAVDNFSYEAAAPVPEPATMALMGTGLLGLAGYARRKKVNA